MRGQSNHSSRFISRFLGSSYSQKRLGEVANVFSGKTINLELENEGGPIAYLKVADLNLPENDRVVTTSSRFVTEGTARTSGLVPIGATIFPKNGAAALHNKKRITSVTTCVDMNTMAVYSTSNTVIPDYLYAYLESQDLAALTLVGAIPQIRAKDVQSLVIPVPPIREQEQYVAVMHQADKSKFTNFKSRFIEITKSERTQHHTLNKLTSIERKNVNPIRGTIYTLYSFPAYDNNRIPEVIDGGDIKSSKLLLTSNTVLYNKLNVRLRRVWNIKELKTNNNICSSEFIPLKVNKDVVLQEYLMYCLTSDTVTEMMESASQGTSNSQQRISPSSLMQVSIPVIPKNEQKHFIELYQQSDKSGFTIAPDTFVTPEKAKKLEQFSLISGDIAMSRKGNVGQCALYPDNFEKGIIASDVVRIRVNKDLIMPQFLVYQLHNSYKVRQQILNVSDGSIMAGINVTKLKKIHVYSTPLERQKQFVSIVKQSDKSKYLS